jgi:hypothetical protein
MTLKCSECLQNHSVNVLKIPAIELHNHDTIIQGINRRTENVGQSAFLARIERQSMETVC